MLNALSFPGHRTKKAIDDDAWDVEFHPQSTIAPDKRMMAFYPITPCKCVVDTDKTCVCAELAIFSFTGSDFTPADERIG